MFNFKPFKKNQRMRVKIHKPFSAKYLKGLVNPDFEEYLKDLDPAPDYSKMSIPVQYDCPAKCNISLTTSLQRIFWAGYNILKIVKDYMDNKYYDYAKQYLKLQDDCWNKNFFDSLVERYGNINAENAEEIEFNRNMIHYLFNEIELSDFPEKFGKFIYAAYKTYDPKNPVLKNN